MDDRFAAQVVKQRRCLKCRETFSSQWAGERVCSRCKGTAEWRNGVPTLT